MSGIVRASALLTLALMLGRLSGFAREVILAQELGVSAAGDAAVLVLTLPDFLVGLLLAGGFNAALVPALRRLDDRDRQQIFIDTSMIVGAVFGVLGLGVFLFPGAVPAIFAPGLPVETLMPYKLAFSLMALSLPIAALTGVSAALLNASKNFFIVGLGTLAFNLVICVVLLTVFDASAAFWTLGLAVFGAALLRWGMQLAIARPSLKPRIYRPKQLSSNLAQMFGAGVLAMGLMVLAPVVFRTLLSFEGSGMLAAFNYAQKLYELPVVILFTPLVTVLLPHFTDSYAEDSTDHSLFEGGAVALLVLAIATLAVGLIFGDAIAQLIYQRGALDAAAMAIVTRTTEVMYLSLPFAALGLLSAAALNAQARTMTVLRNAALALAAGVILALVLGAMAGFVLFHVALAVLNLHALGADLRFRSVPGVLARGTAMISVICVLFGVGMFLPSDLSLVAQAVLGTGAWIVMVSIWLPVLRPLARLRKTSQRLGEAA